MPPAALALVFTAAVLHAAWNLLAKRGQGNPVFFWLALVGSSVIYLPAFIVGVILEPIPPAGWGLDRGHRGAARGIFLVAGQRLRAR